MKTVTWESKQHSDTSFFSAQEVLNDKLRIERLLLAVKNGQPLKGQDLGLSGSDTWTVKIASITGIA